MTGRAPRQLSLRVSLDDEATFSNFFVPSDSATGALAVKHLQQRLLNWQQCEARKGATLLEDFTWLWGSQGAGCSHLLQAVCHAADEAGLKVFYLDFADADSLRPEVLDGLEQLDVLCLDHLDQMPAQSAWEQALFGLYNRLAQSGCALIAAASRSPQQMSFMLPDLLSRLQSAAVFYVQVLDDQHKAAALQMRAIRRGFTISNEVAEFLVRRSERSTSSLFSLLNELDRHSLEAGRRITIPMLKTLMGW
ncbi:DnaA regulatory inactivator Hda [Pseudohongiella spirulinae]|uniref:Putative DnaA protein n=1 Tax=Pseudohongiella spirulinae TaxID=1249552 RepID=A0A0S2KE78_9GAMM|nr:DnaA regulatory inactivator Hda [Pseudohongiella spirulinae]ALO46636.1 Putative DnaA protein [Pseudohongiella spirulinae]